MSIGCELVTSPRLVFLDEPTSGLDSAAAYHVMAAVRRLAQHCRTIIRRVALAHRRRQCDDYLCPECVLTWLLLPLCFCLQCHPPAFQPGAQAAQESVVRPAGRTGSHPPCNPSAQVFALFDKLCLLSEGRVVYFGAADRAVDFFADAGLAVPVNRNPADHFLYCTNRDFLQGAEVEEVGSWQGRGRRWWKEAAGPGMARFRGRPRGGWHTRCSTLHCLNTAQNISALVAQYQSSRIANHVREHVKVGGAAEECTSVALGAGLTPPPPSQPPARLWRKALGRSTRRARRSSRAGCPRLAF